MPISRYKELVLVVVKETNLLGIPTRRKGKNEITVLAKKRSVKCTYNNFMKKYVKKHNRVSCLLFK